MIVELKEANLKKLQQKYQQPFSSELPRQLEQTSIVSKDRNVTQSNNRRVPLHQNNRPKLEEDDFEAMEKFSQAPTAKPLPVPS